ncbi:ATP-grasp domain-containing protein [Paenibacillus silvae]|uniref:ATP-grasp domain-containing protein n=1 Tax=Paenibacillus silvae TaxID=1325358 RepID=A0A2W6P5M4_9BACL|nr:ATP-grasp domain-containing protein [Paenibacillus silvae]PZT53456.1 ATP-grasp domain-containing protein [Paenibacillus silvae]
MTIRSGERQQQTCTPSKVLLTGGRAPVTLDLARMLHRFGHRVYIAESMERHLCRGSVVVEQCALVPSPRHQTTAYLSALEACIKRWQIDLLIPMCEEIFYVAQGAEQLRRHCRVLLSSPEQLHALHHKYDFIQLAKSMGLSVPDTYLIQNSQELLKIQHVLNKSGEWVWKPVYSRFAAKVRMPIHHAPPGEELISRGSPWVAQRYIHGRGLCTYSVVHEGQLVAHAAYESKFRTGDVGASVFFEQVQHDGAYQWVKQFVQQAAFSGQIGFDFIEALDGRVYAIESNPRATSGIHLFYPDDGLVRALLEPESLLNEKKEITPRSGDKAMLALPMLGSGIRQANSRANLRSWMTAWHGARDVVYARQDTRPFFAQIAVVLAAWRTARAQRITLTEALTHDIEWNGEQQ